MKKIGYLGPRGTFSQEALEKYVISRRIEYKERDYNGISDIILGVWNGEVDEAVIPIENSLEGAVNVTLDMMAWDVDLKIKDELVIPITQNLLAVKGSEINDVKVVLSHPQPVGQCRKFLGTVLPTAEIRLVYSTAGAAQEALKLGKGYAAIGSIAAAHAYGLDILSSSIQDNDKNKTRFIIISREDSPKAANCKTSIVFSTEDEPGSLYRVLDIFNIWDINMTRIESRPAKNKLGKYIFFVDIDGHSEDEDVRDALNMVKRKTSFYKFLGSYPIEQDS